ncbi:response regulator transcription factor [Geobacter sp. FeAm09]|uniref:response regulator transcription factor n=1 Tax=Geobacter sp. FeAm09 TaxID=2597769 RepID=UPI0011EF9A49|nr:response regulator transcription factor [Geobacter sp. FeAm09]QEM69893.1 response regulator transcription factor [Geobacter sp. FeAm09]
MDGYTTLHEMLASALKQAGEESGMLLGQELAIALSDSLTTSKTSYFGGLEDACFVIGVESREAYTGQFYLLFSLRDAIVMSSILLGIPPARIQEKKRLCIIESDDIDAFAEIANMINGAFNTVFQGSLPNKVHLKLLSPKKFIPEIDELSENEPLPEGDYLMFRSKLEMPDQELNYLDVLIPVGLGNQFDPPSEEPPAPPVEEEPPAPAEVGDAAVPPQAKAGEGVAPSPEEEPGSAEAGIDSVVVLEDDNDARHQMVTAAAVTGYQVVEGTLNADIKELFSGRNVRLVLIGSQDANDHELAVCIKVNAIRQNSPPPIIMSAQRWTRTAVLKALKYGAREIIIKPCSEEELVAKVRRFCKPPVQ